MNRVRIAHGPRTVEIDASDGPILDLVAAALHTWATCWPDVPEPEPRPPFGLTSDPPDMALNTSLADTAITQE